MKDFIIFFCLQGINAKRRSGGSSPSPPTYNSEGFVIECPKGSLVEKEGAPGVSKPIIASTGVRRFSLRPTETSQASQGPSAITKAIPRWRAGMLQRQINQMNLQKRVRAFSLSDVNTEASRRDKNPTPPPAISPLVDGIRILGGKDQSSKSSQKTVTIVSPRSEEMLVPKANESLQNSSGPGSSKSSKESEEKKTSRSAAAASSTTITIPDNDDPLAFFDDDVGPTIGTNPFDFEAERGTRGVLSVDPNSRTIFGALQNVKSIEAGPRNSRRDSIDATDGSPGNIRGTEKTRFTGSETPTKKQSISSCSTATTDTKSTSRRVSPVSIGAWTESRRNEDRKISNVSQPSASESLASCSRKSSTHKNPNEKPRVSIDSYKPLVEVKIEKPTQNPFERYRATMKLASVDDDSLTEVKIHSTHSDASINESQKPSNFKHESNI